MVPIRKEEAGRQGAASSGIGLAPPPSHYVLYCGTNDATFSTYCLAIAARSLARSLWLAQCPQPRPAGRPVDAARTEARDFL